MKKIVSFLFFLSASFAIVFYTPSAQAHFLVTDRNIGAVLHIDPNDEPIAKSQASFFFEFKDKENKFQPTNCNCTFSIVEDSKEIYSTDLFQNNTNPSLSNASVFYTFPERNVYQIKVVGTPKTPDAFQSFVLVWNFRVDQEASVSPVSSNGQSQTNSNWFSLHAGHLIAAGAVFLFLIFALIKQYMGKSRPSVNTEEKEIEQY